MNRPSNATLKLLGESIGQLVALLTYYHGPRVARAVLGGCLAAVDLVEPTLGDDYPEKPEPDPDPTDDDDPQSTIH
jgi:hypothetical protein